MYQIVRTQKVNASKHELWEFISNPDNLGRITPPQMKFKIISRPILKKIYAGMMIYYSVSPLKGLGLKWLTEITHVSKEKFFVDEQRIGPYKMWHHQHHIIPIRNGMLMKDIITYRPPFGFLGPIINRLFIKKQLQKIFDYREKSLNIIFGIYQEDSNHKIA